jgi:hypothetical protein
MFGYPGCPAIAEISFDVTGMSLTAWICWIFCSVAQLFGPPPIQIDEVTIEDLRIAAVGALRRPRQVTMTFGGPTPDHSRHRPSESAVTVNLVPTR